MTLLRASKLCTLIWLTSTMLCSTDRKTHDQLTHAVTSCIQENEGSETLLLILQRLQETVEDLKDTAGDCEVSFHAECQQQFSGHQNGLSAKA